MVVLGAAPTSCPSHCRGAIGVYNDCNIQPTNLIPNRLVLRILVFSRKRNSPPLTRHYKMRRYQTLMKAMKVCNIVGEN